jgi:hypothetical protein
MQGKKVDVKKRAKLSQTKQTQSRWDQMQI